MSGMALGSVKAHLHGKSLAGDSSIAMNAFRVPWLAENARVPPRGSANWLRAG